MLEGLTDYWGVESPQFVLESKFLQRCIFKLMKSIIFFQVDCKLDFFSS